MKFIRPFPVSATARFFHTAEIPEVIPSTEEAYREYILPIAFRGAAKDEDAWIASLFSKKSDAQKRKVGIVGET